MTLLFIDGFDTYRSTNGSVSQTMFSTNWNLDSTISFNTSGVVGGAISMAGTSGAVSGCYHILPTGQSTIGIGFHMFTDNNPAATTAGICIVYDNAGTARFSLSQDQSGLLSARSGVQTGAILQTSAAPVQLNVYNHYEIKLVNNSGSSSTYEVRLNGNTILSGTFSLSVDLARIRLGNKASAGGTYPTMYWDNFFIWNAAGAINNDWLGERNIYTILPTSDTADADWALSTGVDGYALINDVPAVDTDYLQTPDPGVTSTFGMGNLPSLDIVVIGVQMSARGLKTGTADAEISVGPIGFLGAPVPLLQDSRTISRTIFETNPDTTADWLAAEIDALEVQIERTV